MNSKQTKSAIINYMLFDIPPADFNPSVEAAGCICEFDGKILMLHRHPSRPQGQTWGIPGGKFEPNENARQAVIREIHEEVGCIMNDDVTLQEINIQYIRQPHLDYTFHVFYKSFSVCPEVTLSDEHLQAQWLTVAQAMELPLITGGKEILKHYALFASNK